MGQGWEELFLIRGGLTVGARLYLVGGGLSLVGWSLELRDGSLTCGVKLAKI